MTFVLHPTTLIDEGVAAKEQKTWSGHDRDSTIGASEVGQCARRTILAKLKTPDDQGFINNYGAMERGDVIEAWVVEQMHRALQAKGMPVQLIWATDVGQKTLVRGAQSATPDGMFVSETGFQIEDPDTKQLVTVHAVYNEVKSKDPRPFERMKQADYQHVSQVIQGMDLVRALTEHKPAYAVITYVNASFLHDKKHYVVKFDQGKADGLRKRAEWLLYDCNEQKLPDPEARMYFGGKECDYCPYAKRCAAIQLGQLPQDEHDVTPGIEAELEKLAREYAELGDDTEVIDERRKTIGQEIAKLLQTTGTKKVKAKWGYVSVFSSMPPCHYDTEAMQADGIDPDKYVKPADPYVKVVVRVRDDD